MHVELIVRLPGLYDDKIIYFFPAGGLPQGNILPFSSSTVWNDVHICSMSVWIWAAVRLIFTHTHARGDSHTWKWFQGLWGMWPSRHPGSDTEKQPPALPTRPSTTHHLWVLFLGPLMHPQTPTRARALQHAGANQVLTWSSYVL